MNVIYLYGQVKCLPIRNKPQEITDNLDITQGKLVIGLQIEAIEKEAKFIVSMYNTILGGSPNSKLFQNVRERESLAYTARSSYVRQKNNIFIKCGIEIENYKKAVDIIKEQLEEMKTGKFSDEDLENSRRYILTGIKMLEDEQDTFITYAIGQELSGGEVNVEKYIEKISEVTKEQIVEIAKKIEIDTIYFLTSKEEQCK